MSDEFKNQEFTKKVASEYHSAIRGVANVALLATGGSIPLEPMLTAMQSAHIAQLQWILNALQSKLPEAEKKTFPDYLRVLADALDRPKVVPVGDIEGT